MEHFRRSTRRRILASIACLAFVLQGLVPSIAHAVAGTVRAGLYLGELCSAEPHGARLRLAEAIAAEAPASVPSLPNATHCPFCALPFGGEVPTSTPPAWDLSFEQASHVLPNVSPDDLPARPVQWRPHAPRAPPPA